LLRKGIMDERGSGILRIEGAMEKWELEKPNYAEKDGYFVITFKGPSRVEKPLDEEILRDLNERQKDALIHARKNYRITNREYREICKVSHKTAHEELSQLVERKILVRAGKGRSIYYIFKMGDD